MDYENLIVECKRLRLAFERDEARFLVALSDIEEQHMDMLSQNGCATFENFLKTHNLCDAARYSLFRAGLAKVGREAAEQIGVQAVLGAARIKEPDKAPAFVQWAGSFVEQHGTAPSGQAVNRELLTRGFVEPSAKPAQVVKASNELARLRAENAELRAQLKAEQAKSKRLAETVKKQAETIEELKGRAA